MQQEEDSYTLERGTLNAVKRRLFKHALGIAMEESYHNYQS